MGVVKNFQCAALPFHFFHRTTFHYMTPVLVLISRAKLAIIEAGFDILYLKSHYSCEHYFLQVGLKSQLQILQTWGQIPVHTSVFKIQIQIPFSL